MAAFPGGWGTGGEGTPTDLISQLEADVGGLYSSGVNDIANYVGAYNPFPNTPYSVNGYDPTLFDTNNYSGAMSGSSGNTLVMLAIVGILAYLLLK